MAVGDLSLLVTVPAGTLDTGTIVIADGAATFEEGASAPLSVGDLLALIPATFTYGGDDTPTATYTGDDAPAFTYSGAGAATYGATAGFTYGGDDDPTTTYRN